MPHQAIDRQNHCTHIASGHILSTLPSYNSGHCYCVEQKQLAVLLLRTFIAQSKSSVTPVAVIRPTSVMPPRKRLLLSAYCERVANALARGGDAVPEEELKNAAAEAATLLASQMHLRDTNEWRMCLALLAAPTEAAAPPPALFPWRCTSSRSQRGRGLQPSGSRATARVRTRAPPSPPPSPPRRPRFCNLRQPLQLPKPRA